MSLLAYRDSGEQTFRHVSHNDTDEEDDGVEQGVAEDEGNDKERHAEKDGHGCDDVDKMSNLSGNRRLSDLETRGEVSDTSHHGSVSGGDDDPTSGPFHGVGGEEGDVSCLERVLMSALSESHLRLRLSSQRRVIYLQ